ncbi:unnamed protein product [Dracunculus medinensis]|uniref:Uncharacterized protein n=1 Tax=Dracunculus medinensis TaxID=318479 RepID=A0A0N4UCE5_DRAME|nr:unnamed protein product [Dracunculus medinensis]
MKVQILASNEICVKSYGGRRRTCSKNQEIPGTLEISIQRSIQRSTLPGTAKILHRSLNLSGLGRRLEDGRSCDTLSV